MNKHIQNLLPARRGRGSLAGRVEPAPASLFQAAAQLTVPGGITGAENVPPVSEKTFAEVRRQATLPSRAVPSAPPCPQPSRREILLRSLERTIWPGEIFQRAGATG